MHWFIPKTFPMIGLYMSKLRSGSDTIHVGEMKIFQHPDEFFQFIIRRQEGGPEMECPR